VVRIRTSWGVATVLLIAAAVGWQGPESASGWGLPDQGVPTSRLGGAPTRITRDDSVVVFAAHPDDEVLGAGGLIHAAVRSGARVHIVLFTNGDGYLAGVDANFRTLLSTPGRFIEYGRWRQQEAVAAARRLGVPASHLDFLGYPDRGLAVLWGPAWGCDHPYTSPYTQRNRSPYALAYRHAVSYCGQHVLDDVTSLLRRERPTVIVGHHSDDTHRDHWAAGAFVTAALERLRTEDIPWVSRVRVWSYLIHRGAWPKPTGYAPDLVLAPPADLAGDEAGWTEYGLDRTDQEAKRLATLEYRTQMQLLRPYLLSFVRQNELFDVHAPAYLSSIEAERPPFGETGFWERLPSVIRSAPGSALARAIEGSAQLDTVGVAKDSVRLYVAVRLKRAAIREVEYHVPITLFYRDGRTARLQLLFRVPRALGALQSRGEDLALPPGAVARSSGRHINIVLPRDGMGYPESMLLHVETMGPLKAPVERSPWAFVHLGSRARTASLAGPIDGNRAATPRILESRGPRWSLTQ
jgi:LmbE family N-acetylglucosaminyl deacetylase